MVFLRRVCPLLLPLHHTTSSASTPPPPHHGSSKRTKNYPMAQNETVGRWRWVWSIFSADWIGKWVNDGGDRWGGGSVLQTRGRGWAGGGRRSRAVGLIQGLFALLEADGSSSTNRGPTAGSSATGGPTGHLRPPAGRQAPLRPTRGRRVLVMVILNFDICFFIFWYKIGSTFGKKSPNQKFKTEVSF